MMPDPEKYKYALLSSETMMNYENPRKRRREAFEIAYYNTYGELPDDHWVIEKVIDGDNGAVFVHYGNDD